MSATSAVTIVLSPELYNIVYFAIMVGEVELNRKELRAIARVTDKVEAIGEKDDAGNFKLVEESGVLILDRYDADILNKVVSAVKWKPGAARKIIPLFDALDEGRKEDESR